MAVLSVERLETTVRGRYDGPAGLERRPGRRC
jgi:hypothetical protein